jgi:hypothetical protein
MKKMKTLFVTDHNTKLATQEVRKECEWVIKGEGKATIKFDGTAAIFMKGKLFKLMCSRQCKFYGCVHFYIN